MTNFRWCIQAVVYPIEQVDLCWVELIPEEKRIPVIVNWVKKETLDILRYNWEKDGKRVFENTGRVSIKKEAHEVNDLHMAVHMWIYNSKWEILIQKRTEIKDSYPGLWDISIAWHVSSGETMLSWAVREAREEFWMNITEEELVPIWFYREEMALEMPWYDNGWFNNELNEVFVLRFDGNISELRMQPEEVSEVKFVSLEWLEKQWSTPEGAALFTPKSVEYRQMVIDGVRANLKKFAL